ncbi:histidine kinase [Streptomyces sp. JV176]|uniref:sensor histidine kinase n=1 Tax=Streptomyces sp. JV176 TaxID=858630 RepID=UPI002E78E1C9|nr:histidine kinase [Streptomyces sp. JV176]MEE1800706.1 histidine kinase [Streptomyces sp. JV176]
MRDLNDVAALPDRRGAPGSAAMPYAGTTKRAASLRQAVKAHPFLWDTALAAVIASVATVLEALSKSGPSLSGRDAGAAGVTFLLLLARRRAPLTVLALALSGAVTAIVAAPANAHLLQTTAMIALYTVTAASLQWPAITATAVTAMALYVANAHAAGSVISGETFGVVAFVGMAAAVGFSVRTWRSYVAAAEERAERAEATLEEEARRRVAEERLRIARELHDVIAHHIALINVQAGVASHLARTRPDRVEVALGHIHEAGSAVLDELGQLLYVLRRSGEESMPTEPLPGLSRLGQLLESFTAAGLAIRQQVAGEPRPLPAATDLAAYRIIQEGLTNAHKHGREPGARLLLEYRTGALDITILNTMRATGPTAGTGHGLTGMRERARATGGALSAGPEPDGTFRLHARLLLPFTQETVPSAAADEGNPA